MQQAIELARTAESAGEVPVGALVVLDGEIIGRGHTAPISTNDPTAHAEILCIREICNKQNAQRAPGYDLYITLEPCAMCAAAISFARLNRVIFGADDPKGGGVLHGGKFYDQPTCHHKPTIVHGILAEECGQILKDFFKEKRKNAKKA